MNYYYFLTKGFLCQDLRTTPKLQIRYDGRDDVIRSTTIVDNNADSVYYNTNSTRGLSGSMESDEILQIPQVTEIIK